MKLRRWKRAAALLLAAAVLSGATGCGTYRSTSMKPVELTPPPIAGEGGTNPEGTEVDDVFAGAAADFAVSLFQNSAGDSENAMVSPLSVLLALAMTANGADGNTLRQMEQTLGGGMSIDELNRYCKAYAEKLPSTSKSRFSIANSIWIRDSFDVRSEFLTANHHFYDAAVYKAPFTAQTVDDINRWVCEKTRNMIDGIIDQISPDTVMFLINAIAFDAEWETVYEETQVRKGGFTAEDGTKRAVDMMFSEEAYYIEDGRATGFIKNYLDGYAFVGLLPNEGVTVDDYIASLSGDGFLKMLAAKKTTVVYAALPKFETEYSLDLREPLCAMGMSDAFGKEADFSGMDAGQKLYIDSVKHKTYINVDERGTKAGAVTSVTMNVESMPQDYYEVYLDRPFVYAIVDTQTNLPIFIGAVRTVGENQ